MGSLESSCHLPFVGSGRRSWDAWHAGNYGSAAFQASMFGVEALSVRWAGQVRGSGGLMMVTSVGTLVPVAYPLSTSGAAVASHGVVVMGRALLEFSKVKEKQRRVVGRGAEVGKGPTSYKFPDKKELTKILKIEPDQIHPVKKSILGQFKTLLRDKNFKNPDIGIDHLGNIVFKCPVTKQTIPTQVPLTDFAP